jgi:hypothetical protein
VPGPPAPERCFVTHLQAARGLGPGGFDVLESIVQPDPRNGGATMAELTTAKRDRLRDSSFAYIDKDGERHLPINDESHVRNAISRFDQTEFEDTSAKHAAARRIMSAAKRHDIDVSDDSDVAKAAKR